MTAMLSSTKCSFAVFCVVVVAGSSMSGKLEAAPITFCYVGTIDAGFPDSSPFTAFSGQEIEVTYTFESTTPDNNMSANGDYLNTISSMVVTLGSNTWTGTTGTISINNNDVNPDQYRVNSFSMSGPSIGGIANPSLRLNFSDTTNSVFGNDMLPLVQPDPSIFSSVQINLQFVSDDPDEFGDITANNAQFSSVPEPSGLALLVLGLFGLVRRRR